MNVQTGDSGRFRFDLEQRIEAAELRIASLEKYMWHGNGKPGLMTRMELMEDTVTKINANLSKIVWLLIATLSAVLVKLFVR